MLFGEKDLREKINKVHNKKKYKNYNNIELFSTIDSSIIVSPPNLEGFISDTKPVDKKETDTAKKLASAYKITLDKLTDSNVKIDISGNTTISNDEINRLREVGEKYYEKVKSKKQSLINNLNDIGETITNPTKLKQKVKVKESFIEGNGDPVEPPTTFKDIIIGIQNFFSFFLNFINNTLVYISIVLIQFIYGDKPILPWGNGNIKKMLTVKNWPWKLDLNVSSMDNLVLDPSAVLYDKTGDPVPDGNGGSISAEQYNTNQKILYDANIVFNLFTQIILVALTWVFTNNAYYYIYNDESIDIKSSSFPYRVILPNNEVNGINVKRGFSIIPFTFVNTLVTSSYDMLFLSFYFIKWITQKIGLYEFRALTYIFLFLIILWFSLTYFWDVYNTFMEEPFAYVFNPFFAIFIIYGLYQHFFKVSIVDDKNKVIGEGEVLKVNFLHFCSLFIIFSLLIALYPIIRIFFYFWGIYVFFGLQGFGNKTFDDVMKHENKKTCDSNKVTIMKIIRGLIQSFFQYFFYFVVFILIISNFIYLNTIPTFNSSSSSSMKIFLIMVFLFVFMFLVYSLLNRNTAKKSKIVVYGDSYIKEEAPALGDIVNKIDMPKFDTPKTSDSTTTVPKLGETTGEGKEVGVENIKTPGEEVGVENLKTPGEEPIVEEPEKPISLEYINVLKTKIKDVLDKLENKDEDENPATLLEIKDNISATLFPVYKNNLYVFKDTLKKIKEILESPILAELVHTPFYITKLVKKIENNTSIPDNIKPYVTKTIQFLKEIIFEGIDVRISNFINEVSNLPFTTDIPENIAKIKAVFTKEITEMNYKVAKVLNRVFPNETSNAISMTQIYNTHVLKALFVNAEPEMAIFAMIVSEVFPEETKGGIINSLTSAAKVVRNTFR